MDKKFFTNNRKKLVELIKDDSALILFAGEAPKKSADEAYDFTPNRNFYYMTGIDREKLILLITKKKGKVEETLFIEEADPVLEKWVGKRITADESKAASGIEKISYLKDFESSINNLFQGYNFERLYLDLERDAFESLASNSQVFAKTVIEKYPFIRIENAYNTICDLRVIKAPEEIKVMREAIDITQAGIENMMKNAKPGMMEYEIEAYFNYTLKKAGCTDFAFHTIAAAGQNGTVLHYNANNCKADDNELILCDLGAEYGYYKADITRTFPVNGKFTERQKQIYNIVLKANLETIKAIKAGVPKKSLNEFTKKVLADGLKEIGLIKEDAELFKYYYHGVSHYLGLDTHDVGNNDVELKSGMVLTVEPGLYVEEEKIGIRIEDDVVVTDNGCVNLSENIIKTIDQIEAFMK